MQLGLFAGLILGALIGASVAVVLVPASPSEMRDRLRAKAADMTQTLAPDGTT